MLVFFRCLGSDKPHPKATLPSYLYRQAESRPQFTQHLRYLQLNSVFSIDLGPSLKTGDKVHPLLGHLCKVSQVKVSQVPQL
jgi:hypothetical protein